MHLKTALFGLNFDAFEYSWDETGGATRIGLALLLIGDCLWLCFPYKNAHNFQTCLHGSISRHVVNEGLPGMFDPLFNWCSDNTILDHLKWHFV